MGLLMCLMLFQYEELVYLRFKIDQYDIIEHVLFYYSNRFEWMWIFVSGKKSTLCLSGMGRGEGWGMGCGGMEVLGVRGRLCVNSTWFAANLSSMCKQDRYHHPARPPTRPPYRPVHMDVCYYWHVEKSNYFEFWLMARSIVRKLPGSFDHWMLL